MAEKSTSSQKPQPEFIQFVSSVEQAPIQAGMEARKLAEQTGTPLVIREKETAGETLFPPEQAVPSPFRIQE